MDGDSKCARSQPSAYKFCPLPRCLPVPISLALAILAVCANCGSKSGLAARVSQLEKAFPAKTRPEQTDQPGPRESNPADAGVYVGAALGAFHSNDYATAVILLR